MPINPPKPGTGAQLLAQDAILLIDFEQPHHAIELSAQFGNMKRFRHVIGGAHPRGFDGALDRAVLRQNHHGGLRIDFADMLQEFQPAHLRDAQVRDHNVDRILFEDFECFLGGGGRPRVQAGVDDHVAAQIPRRVFVLNNQDADREGTVHRYRRFCSGCAHAGSPFGNPIPTR